MRQVKAAEAVQGVALRVEDGAVECVVITGDDERAMGAFADHGKIVFEMFYRVDLSTMGA